MTYSNGLITAHAGKTKARAYQARVWWAHPRSRGENPTACRGWATRPGSSPLTRGKPRLRRQGISQRGLIPAHAGKTPRTRRACSATWAHPRSRGENEAARQPHGWETGSSPLTRGKRLRGRPRHRYRRLIPAHAGKTASTSTSTTSTRAHPRSRGENQRIKSVAASVTGSSPLTRGKHNL